MDEAKLREIKLRMVGDWTIKLRLVDNGTAHGWKFWPTDPEQTIRPFGDEHPSQVLFLTASQTMRDIQVHVPCGKRCGWTREVDGVLITDHSDHTRTLTEKHLPVQVETIRQALADAWEADYTERTESRATRD